MAAWAADARFGRAAFVCACVDPDPHGTSKEFRQLYFRRAPSSLINGYIDDRADFPNFDAQLGCQGFVIFNSSHKIVQGATPAWLQYRDGAFKNVEAWLNKLLGPAAPENPLGAPVGQLVRIVGLQSESGAALNGSLGEVIGSNESGRILVTVREDNKAFKPDNPLAFKPGNLEDATGAPIGKRFKVCGLTSDKGRGLNGQEGEVLGGTDGERFIVRLGDGMIALRKENLQEVTGPAAEEGGAFSAVKSVGHEGMDAQHSECIDALQELSRDLTVKALNAVRKVLKEHFDDEERLMDEAGFGGGAKSGKFSAFSSHSKDHDRIIGIADDALASLSNVCGTSDSYGGTVPKEVAASLCKAFVDHATMYDSLYEEKIAAHCAGAEELEQMDRVD